MTIFLINCYHKENVQFQQMNYDFTNPEAFFVHQEAEYYDSASVVVRGSHYW